MKRDILSIDFETFSEINLKNHGSSRYARHPSTEALMLGYALNDEPAKVIRFAEGEKAPKWVKEALRDPDVVKSAWNSGFERQILQHVFGLTIPYVEWYDPMVLAFSLSFPGKLEEAGRIGGLPFDKQKDARGKALIRKFCGLRKPTKKEPFDRATHLTNPKEWEEFVEYCAQDVETERAFRKAFQQWDLPAHEWQLWHLDQEINDLGLPINMRVVRKAIKIAEDVVESRMAAMKEITGLQNPNSGPQLLPWLKKQGYKYNDLKAGHVKSELERVRAERRNDPDLERVLEMRQEVSKSSVKKYNTLARSTDRDSRLRNTLQFAGAGRTWRFGGRMFQPQNLAKPVKYLEDHQETAVRHLELLDTEAIELIYDKPMDLLSNCVRPVVQAEEGHLLIDADLSAIENRVLGWLAGDEKILDVFRQGRDPYVDFAKYMTGRTYEDLWHEYKVLGDKGNRTLAKPGVLGCGFMLSAGEFKTDFKTGEKIGTGLLGYAQNMGVTLTPQQSAHAVKVFRETYKDVVNFWYRVERAMRDCIVTKRPTKCSFLRFDISGPFCRMHLPSGHCLHYYRPRVEEKMAPWGKPKLMITYEGSSDTGRAGKGKWGRISTHPGKITENAVQAIARDLLVYGKRLMKKRTGVVPFLHVHDQIIAQVPAADADERLEQLIACMSVVPKWAPGLILGAEGHAARYFVKD